MSQQSAPVPKSHQRKRGLRSDPSQFCSIRDRRSYGELHGRVNGFVGEATSGGVSAATSDGFVFGVATSAYQVEGAASEDGRGDSIWDVFTKTQGNIKDGSNGDVAADQYHRYMEDVELIANLGFQAYRFSISWSRIFPDGLGEKVNEKGVAYYNNLIDFLLKKGIQPFVTLYHWDLPSKLNESEGGWLRENIVEYFAMYAETCFARFGDRVKHWITINEPLQTAINSYSIGIFAPGRRDNPYKEPYIAGHYQIFSHAAVRVYRKKFKVVRLGLVVDCEWAEPFSDKVQDKVAAARRLDFQLGWFLDPIYYGDYPAVMRERLGDNLPKFSERDKELLRNSLDFIGLNHYTSRLIAHSSVTEEGPHYQVQEMERIGMDDEEDETASIDGFLNDEKRIKYFRVISAQLPKQSERTNDKKTWGKASKLYHATRALGAGKTGLSTQARK
ncbi:hypothetical protein HPP92_001257 [Vanilla planifolia]|uniref:Beta-glucosidase n=1 Tax=Vanilla planifolia TaxID=51239 RepID=A0A835RQR5_VANPL|nr:hypothetical protein HPP92_001257 [Vanilla planifolia]